MTAQRSTVPSLRRQKEKHRPDRAFVVLDGRKMSCGRWGTDEARQRYDRLIAEWLASGRRLHLGEAHLVTIAVLADRFFAHAKQHYRHRDGTPTSKLTEYKRVLAFLLETYADLPVEEFSPRRLLVVRQRMVDAGWARSTINDRVRLLKHVFRWGAEHELAAPAVHQALATVRGLQRGRSEARETEPVRPVSEEMVEATKKYLTPTLRAMVDLQWLTGMRPADVCALTAAMLDMSGEVWIARLPEHKMAYLDRSRMVFIGPRAQKVVTPYLKHDLATPIFSPVESERERREAARQARSTPESCGNRPGMNRTAKPRRTPADCWSTDSYGRAIAYACERAFPPPAPLARMRVPAEGRKADRLETHAERRARLYQEGRLNELERWLREHTWSPNRVRHAHATRVRREHGLEAAQILLGHARADVTQVYAERDLEKALRVAHDVG